MSLYEIHSIPFSVPGSYLTIGKDREAGPRLIYRTCSTRPTSTRNAEYFPRDFFAIALLKDGVEVPYRWVERAERLDLLAAGGGRASFTFMDLDTLLFESEGVQVRLIAHKPMSTTYACHSGAANIVDGFARCHHLFRAASGERVSVSAPGVDLGQTHRKGLYYQVDFSGNLGALRVSFYESRFDDTLPVFQKAAQQWKTHWDNWLAKIPAVPAAYHAAAEQAWYLMWNSEVAPSGVLTRPAVLMSKYWMNSIWSWDNCFNALSIARANPELAWSQLLLFFEHLDPNGIAPDQINDLYEHYCFTKPPIQGWTVMKMIDLLGVEACRPYLEQLFAPMVRLTEWWYTMRDFDGDGVCQYHHGNDSGWDNSTAFDGGYPAESPDLAAHLVLQCEGLANMAAILGREDDASAWNRRARLQLDRLLQHSLREGRFVTLRDSSHAYTPSLSLLNYIPLELGRRLPRAVFADHAADLKPGGRWLTNYGLATEAPSSPKYEPNGYWRGPIWGPSTMLIFDGLADGGETDLARTVARQFCDMCVQSPGFWENYDALSGKGLDCPGYTWTAACFLLMAEWLGQNPAPARE